MFISEGSIVACFDIPFCNMNQKKRKKLLITIACFADSTIDYIAQYRLVNRSHLEMYGRAFTLEDEDEDGLISYEVILAVCDNHCSY